MATVNTLQKIVNIPALVSKEEIFRINIGLLNPFSNTTYENFLLGPRDKVGLLPGYVACIDSTTGTYKVCTQESDIALGIFIIDSRNDFQAVKLYEDFPAMTIAIGGMFEIDLYETYSYLDSITLLDYQNGDVLYCSPFGLLTNEVNLTSQMRPMGIVVRKPTEDDPRMVVKLHEYATNPDYSSKPEVTIAAGSVPFLSIASDQVLSLRTGITGSDVALGNHVHEWRDIVGLHNSITDKIPTSILPDEALGIKVYTVSTLSGRDVLPNIERGSIVKVVSDPNPNNNATYVFDGLDWVEFSTSQQIEVVEVSIIADRNAYFATRGDIIKVTNDPNPNNNKTYAFDGNSWVTIGRLKGLNVTVFATVLDRDLALTTPEEGDMAIVTNDPTDTNNRVYVWDQDTTSWYSTGDGIISPIDVTIVNTLIDRDMLTPSEGDIALVTGDPVLSNRGAFIWDDDTSGWHRIESVTTDWVHIVNKPVGIVVDANYEALKVNWNTAYVERHWWDGSASGLNAATGRSSLGLGDAATRNVGTGVSDVAAGVHTHPITDIVSLPAVLNTKSPIDHTHVIDDVAGLGPLLDTFLTSADLHNPVTIKPDSLDYLTLAGQELGLRVGTTLTTVARGAHTHPIADIVSLQAKLNLKADAVNMHEPVAIAPGSAPYLSIVGQFLSVKTGTTADKLALGAHTHSYTDIPDMFDAGKIKLELLPSFVISKVHVVNTLAERDALASIKEGDFVVVTADPVPANNGSYIYDDTYGWLGYSAVTDWSAIVNKPSNLLYTTDIIDNLTSSSAVDALSANQGRVLLSLIGGNNPTALLNGKVDKVPFAVVSNFATFVSGGNIQDSGLGASSFEPVDPTILRQANLVDSLLSTSVTAPPTANQVRILRDMIIDVENSIDLSVKMDKVPAAISGRIAVFNAAGQVLDSGTTISGLTAHSPVTIQPLSAPFLTLTGQELGVVTGNTPNTLALGDHTHSGLLTLNGTQQKKVLRTNSAGTGVDYLDDYHVGNFTSFVLDVFDGFFPLSLELEKPYQLLKLCVKLMSGNCNISLVYNTSSGVDLALTTGTNVEVSNLVNINQIYQTVVYSSAEINSVGTITVPTGSTLGFRVVNSSLANKLAVTVHYRKTIS